MDPHALGVFIPILAVATGFVAVFGRTILKPILQATMQQKNVAGPSLEALERKIAELENRLASTEGTVDTLLEEREFMRKLASGRTQGSVTPGP